MTTDLRYLQVDYSTPPADGDMMRYESSSGLWLPDTYTYPTLVDLTTGWVDYDVSSLSYSSALEIAGAGSGSQIPVRKGSRITWTQASTQKFGIVTGGSNNSITIAENDDYEFSNNAITNFQYSLMPIPYKNLEDFNIYFPQFFNFTPVVTKLSGAGTLAGYTVNSFVYSMDEMYVNCYVDITYDVDTNTIDGLAITLPVTAKASIPTQHKTGVFFNQSASAAGLNNAYSVATTNTKTGYFARLDQVALAVNTNNHKVIGDFKYIY